MSKGTDHAAASIGVGVILLFFTGTLFERIQLLLGSILGIFLTPDLDQGMSYHGGKKLRAASPLFFQLWMLYWKPYALLIPHRHYISHAPLLGTLLRTLYAEIPFFIYLLFQRPEALGNYIISTLTSRVFWGLCASDFLHFVMDFYDPD